MDFTLQFMNITRCQLEGIRVISSKSYHDIRGFFLESYQQNTYEELGITETFVQDNHSRSIRNVIRGLHFTKSQKQSQLLTVINGTIFDVVVDIRPSSVTFGHWYGVELSDTGPNQIYMPGGFAHGFCTLSSYADLHYKVSEIYDPSDEGGLLWNDKSVGIDWPVSSPLLSNRDREFLGLEQFRSFG